MFGGNNYYEYQEEKKWPDFHWWREGLMGYVGRPPSPFPAPFEKEKMPREDSALPRLRHLGRDVEDQENGAKNANGEYSNGIYEEPHRLFWPLCQGPPIPDGYGDDDLYGAGLNDGDGMGRKKKTPRLPGKRPPWRPAKMPNKFGITQCPPPYTNYCKETLFDTNNPNPTKVTPGGVRTSIFVAS